jgi:hypothetical protein
MIRAAAITTTRRTARTMPTFFHLVDFTRLSFKLNQEDNYTRPPDNLKFPLPFIPSRQGRGRVFLDAH